MSDVRTYHTTTGLNETGHLTFAWDPEDNEWMLPLIEDHMERGEEFWIVRRNPLREERLVSIDQIGHDRHVISRSPRARQLLEQGRIRLVRDDDEDLEVVRPARTAQEAVENDTIAHRPLRGG